MSSSFDGSVALPRKLTEDETKELRILLLPFFHASGNTGNLSPEDISDFLDYAIAMISNNKTIDYIIQELLGMDMGFFPHDVATRVGNELCAFLKPLVEGNKKVDETKGEKVEDGGKKSQNVGSLKSSGEKGNALTMSGALEASRQGGRENKEKHKKSPVNKRDSQQKGRDSHRGRNSNLESDRGRSDRGGRMGGRAQDREGRRTGRMNDRGERSIQKQAFDRLSRGKPDEPPLRRLIDQSGPGGRGREGRHFYHGRDATAHGDRMTGNRRGRNENEDQEFMPMNGGRDARGGRGREGRGRAGLDGANKRIRYDEGYDNEGYVNNGPGYGRYDGYGYGDGGNSSYPPQRGTHWHGRGVHGRGRGRGRDGRGVTPVHQNGEEVAEGRLRVVENYADDTGVAYHPSSMVQASHSEGRGGFGYFNGGRGRFGGRGRGHGRTFPGRAEVVSMIQSKTWVRKKDNGGDTNAPLSDATPNELAEG